jgi:glycosyltransferase involved in cell wall biosynthesis
MVSPSAYPYVGGIETHVKELSERLVKRGFEVEIASTDRRGKLENEETVNGVKIKRFKTWAPNEAYYFSEGLRKYLSRNAWKYEVIHAHSYHALPALYASLAKRTNCFVFTPHFINRGQTVFRNLLHIPYKLIAKRIFKKADTIVCVSEYEKRLIAKNFVSADKIQVIPNGINLDEISKFRWNPTSFRPKLTYAGRLERRQKNVDKLIYALDLLTQKYGVDSELLIIGCGPYATDMIKLVKKLKLEKRVTWKTWLPRHDYLKEIASSHLFIMPSDYECYCIVVVEAMAMGVPTVVADTTALSDYVRKEAAFGIKPPITPQSIAQAINTALLSRRKTLRLFDQIVSWDEVVSRLVKEAYCPN